MPATCDIDVHICHDLAARIECKTGRTDGQPGGYPVLEIGPVALWPTVDQLVQLRGVIDQWLHEHDRPDGSADRVDIVPIPAEAVADSPDLFAPVADDLLPREFPALDHFAASIHAGRSAWGDEPTAAELATGAANCPGQVP